MSKHSKRFLFGLLLAAATTTLLPAQALAQRITPLALQQWRLGQDLARYGLEQGDPQALLTAARLQRASGLRPSRAQVEGGVEQTDPATLLQQAKALAKDKPELLAMIEAASVVRRSRGTTIGPQVQPILMGARDSKPIHLSYKPGQRAFFGVTSDRLQDIAFSVQNPKNEPVCEPTAAGPELLCEWVSGDPSDVRVMVTNRGANAVMLTFFHD